MPPGNPTVAITRLLRQAFTTSSVTKATSIHFIDSNNRIKKRRGRKTALSGYYECVATHTNFLNFKTALYFSAVVMKDFTSSRYLFQAEITTVKLKVSFLLNVSLCIRPLTFINKALRLLGSPFVVSTASP